MSATTPEAASPPPDPRAGRYRRLVLALRVAAWSAAALAVVTLLVPDAVARVSGVALVAVIVLTPLARTAWFARRWRRRGDPRFAAVGAGVLLVIVTGAAVALVLA